MIMGEGWHVDRVGNEMLRLPAQPPLHHNDLVQRFCITADAAQIDLSNLHSILPSLVDKTLRYVSYFTAETLYYCMGL